MATDTTIAATVSFLLCYISAFVAGQEYTSFYTAMSVVPQVLPAPPPELLGVVYRGGLNVAAGETLDPRKVRYPPIFSWQYQEGKNYTLLMLDLDVPSRNSPLRTSLLHFLVMNITRNDVYRSDVVFDYFPPTPLPFTGLHRYCFFVYEETSYTTSPSLTDRLPFRRLNFNLNNFVNDFNVVRNPQAGNCFQAEFSGF